MRFSKTWHFSKTKDKTTLNKKNSLPPSPHGGGGVQKTPTCDHIGLLRPHASSLLMLEIECIVKVGKTEIFGIFGVFQKSGGRWEAAEKNIRKAVNFYIQWWQPQISISIRNIFFSQNEKKMYLQKSQFLVGKTGEDFLAKKKILPNVQISKTGHHIGGWDLYFKAKIFPTL